MWIKVREVGKDIAEWVVNTDNIAAIHVPSSTVFINGNTGNRNGILHIGREDIDRILELVKGGTENE